MKIKKILNQTKESRKVMKGIFKKLLVTFLIICLGIYIISCTKRVFVPINRNFLEKESFLHVKLISGKEVKVKEPRFEDGMLLGLTPVYETRPGPDKEIKISLNQIESITVERHSWKKTIITFTAIASAFVVFYLYTSQYKNGFN